MKGKGILIIIFCFFICSCARYSSIPSSSDINVSTHKYILTVKDTSGKSIEGAEISYTIEKNHKVIERGEFITKSDGKFTIEVSHSYRKSLYHDNVKFSSSLKYGIKKQGFYTKNGYDIIYDSDRTKTILVTLLKPVDYLHPNFLPSKEGELLKDNILKFIDLIILKSLLVKAELKPRSINIIKFKDKNYLEFEFKSLYEYNSLRMSKYDIGKNLFDEVIRKVLTPLNDYISDPKIFYGYSLKIIGYTRDFSKDYLVAMPITYQFLLPEAMVRKYKNKDISGQQLLDSSIILMDNDRIELKLN